MRRSQGFLNQQRENNDDWLLLQQILQWGWLQWNGDVHPGLCHWHVSSNYLWGTCIFLHQRYLFIVSFLNAPDIFDSFSNLIVCTCLCNYLNTGTYISIAQYNTTMCLGSAVGNDIKHPMNTCFKIGRTAYGASFSGSCSKSTDGFPITSKAIIEG